ncbi:MAG TPA: Crp/Fnr family transcriptional regulator [Actinomycetota bacterium]|nr:Crp/Fnr family transcriptional regulator [Actinomycetota bacterium]
MDADRTGNLLLDALTEGDRTALLERARRHAIDAGKIRRYAGDPIDSVFFPVSGTLSLIVERDGNEVETATVGREGVADVYAAVGSGVAPTQLLGQAAGESIDVDVEIVRTVHHDSRAFREVMQSAVEALFAQTNISLACLAMHHVTERCARWLLETHDRVDADTFEMRQEFLARMLAVQRPTVSNAASALQDAGLISYSRGMMRIVDREGLEEAACSCYEAVRSEYARLVLH